MRRWQKPCLFGPRKGLCVLPPGFSMPALLGFYGCKEMTSENSVILLPFSTR